MLRLITTASANRVLLEYSDVVVLIGWVIKVEGGGALDLFVGAIAVGSVPSSKIVYCAK